MEITLDRHGERTRLAFSLHESLSLSFFATQAAMVSVDNAKHSLALRHVRQLQSRGVLWVLLINRASLTRVLQHAAVVGSVWAALRLVFGAFYDKPWQLPGVAVRVAYTIGFTLTEYAARGFRPRFAEWTLSFEVVQAVARCLLSNYGDRLLLPDCARFLRRQSEVIGSAVGHFTARRLKCATETFEHNGLEHIWVRSKCSQASRRRVVVVYYHGGGFAVLSPRFYMHFACELQRQTQQRLEAIAGSEELQVDLLLANYRKIPEHPYPIPAQDAMLMYKYVIQTLNVRPSEVVVAGDSAGAGLAMATLLRLRDESPDLLPAAGVLMCPYVDLEVESDERKLPYCILADKVVRSINSRFHPRQGDPSTWGYASPVHCNLRDLPPVYIQAAELDYILSHSQRLLEKARQDGAEDWQLEVFPNVSHAFSFVPTPLLPCAARGVDAMATFTATALARTLGQVRPSES